MCPHTSRRICDWSLRTREMRFCSGRLRLPRMTKARMKLYVIVFVDCDDSFVCFIHFFMVVVGGRAFPGQWTGERICMPTNWQRRKGVLRREDMARLFEVCVWSWFWEEKRVSLHRTFFIAIKICFWFYSYWISFVFKVFELGHKLFFIMYNPDDASTFPFFNKMTKKVKTNEKKVWKRANFDEMYTFLYFLFFRNFIFWILWILSIC